MLMKIGHVYNDPTSDADFIIALESHNQDDNVLVFRMINATNWVILEQRQGKLMASGDVSCPDMQPDAYVLVAESVEEYYRKRKKTAPARSK